MSERPTTEGLRVGDPDPWERDEYQPCCEAGFGWACTAPPGHAGPHVATDGERVLAVDDAMTESSRHTVTLERLDQIVARVSSARFADDDGKLIGPMPMSHAWSAVVLTLDELGIEVEP